METTAIWEMLSDISIGTIVSWVIVIGVILGTISTGAIKIYKLFEKYKKTKDENDALHRSVEKHEETLSEIRGCLKNIEKSLKAQQEVNLKQVRYSIVEICEEAVLSDHITINKLKLLEELFEEYVQVFHGNGYVADLVGRVRQLKIVGDDEDEE